MSRPRAYYNEIDPNAAAWLRELIARGEIMDGVVDERSIADVRADELLGFTRCHFFAGIGGWDYALRLAGWDAQWPVWTGSCPCQPFSVAGQGAGQSDVRHLWPVWFDLIRQCRPDTVFGEQVEAAIRHDWLDLVQADLEREGYAVAPVVLPAAGFGAPHGRHRLWFVADSRGERRQQVAGSAPRDEATHGRAGRDALEPHRDHVVAGDGEDRSRSVADADGRHTGAKREQPSGKQRFIAEDGRAAVGLADSTNQRHERSGGARGRRPGSANDSAACRVAHDHKAGLVLERSGGLLNGERQARGDDADRRGQDGALAHASGARSSQQCGGRIESEGSPETSVGRDGVALGDPVSTRLERFAGDVADRNEPGRLDAVAHRPAPTSGFWGDCEWIPCRDGKWRPVEPGTFPLAHGVPARVGRLRGYGNAIVPQVAAEVIAAFMEVAA